MRRDAPFPTRKNQDVWCNEVLQALCSACGGYAAHAIDVTVHKMHPCVIAHNRTIIPTATTTGVYVNVQIVTKNINLIQYSPEVGFEHNLP